MGLFFHSQFRTKEVPSIIQMSIKSQYSELKLIILILYDRY